MLALYENIRELRKLNHWTQEELALRMGYTDRSTIAKIEAGKVDLSQSKILDFAKVFRVDPGDLMGEVIVEPYSDGVTTKALELYYQYQYLPPEKQTEFLSFLKFLQSKS